ncbi:MAG: CoA pyrophosphatase [Pseudomonadota bacterium]
MNTQAIPDFLKRVNVVPMASWEDLPLKSAAVLVLFVKRHQTWNLLLTRRSAHLNNHRGQIGFPGGMREKEDASPEATALREYEEELGVPLDRVCVLGCLKGEQNIDHLHVIPVVAFTTDPGLFHPSTHEVAEVWEVAIEELANFSVFRFNSFGQWRSSDLFQTHAVNIWGLSARILRSAGFPELLKAGSEPDSLPSDEISQSF